MIVAPASAAPVIFGALLLAGEAGDGSRPLGALGGVESSTYATPDEQADVLPAASVAVTWNVVDESSDDRGGEAG